MRELSDEEIDNLLFMPGFSTAAEVSDLSGPRRRHGRGQDRSIQALGGRITISLDARARARPSRSALPLTLAVLDGMVVSVADETLVVPLTAIVETLKPDAAT